MAPDVPPQLVVLNGPHAGTAIVLVEQDVGLAKSASRRLYCLLEGRVTLSGHSADITRDAIGEAYPPLRALNIETAYKAYPGVEYHPGAVAFFDLSGGLKLAIWAQDDIAHDTGLPKSPPSATSFTIGHNVRSGREVDALMAKAASAGALIVKPAQKTFYGGYAGYFQDPDGHLWEVVFNPQMLPPEG